MKPLPTKHNNSILKTKTTMGIIKHFSEGNNDQEYNGLHSHWKDEEPQPAVIHNTDDSLLVAMNTAYNKAIDDAIGILEKHNKIYEGVPDLIKCLTELKK